MERRVHSCVCVTSVALTSTVATAYLSSLVSAALACVLPLRREGERQRQRERRARGRVYGSEEGRE
eukprot:281183-Rhodomonas_salina.1